MLAAVFFKTLPSNSIEVFLVKHRLPVTLILSQENFCERWMLCVLSVGSLGPRLYSRTCLYTSEDFIYLLMYSYVFVGCVLSIVGLSLWCKRMKSGKLTVIECFPRLLQRFLSCFGQSKTFYKECIVCQAIRKFQVMIQRTKVRKDTQAGCRTGDQ